MSPKLSFAIPTYNFGAFISDTIKDIEENAQTLTGDQFEILVLDGGSTDQTDEVMSELSAEYPNIRYIKNSTRGGIDRDLNEVANLCTGEFIWLFSADDLVVEGWDTALLPHLTDDNDLVLVPAILCDFEMRTLRPNPIFLGCDETKPVRFEINDDPATLDDYLSRIATLEATFSFMSAVVIKSSVWRDLPVREDYFGSCWAHCARLMPLFHQTTTITYLNQYLIRKRGGNDSFMEHGFVKRISIAVDGWGRIISEFFPKKAHKEILYAALRRDMPLLLFIYAKITSRAKQEVANLDRMLDFLYRDTDLPLQTRLYWIVYRVMPSSRLLNVLLQPLLPFLVRIRHKVKSLLA